MMLLLPGNSQFHKNCLKKYFSSLSILSIPPLTTVRVINDRAFREPSEIILSTLAYEPNVHLWLVFTRISPKYVEKNFVVLIYHR